MVIAIQRVAYRRDDVFRRRLDPSVHRHPSVRLSINYSPPLLCGRMSVYPSDHPASNHSFVLHFLPISPSLLTYPSTNLPSFFLPPFHPSVCPSLCLSFCLSFHLSCPFVLPSVLPSFLPIYLCIYFFTSFPTLFPCSLTPSLATYPPV